MDELIKSIDNKDIYKYLNISKNNRNIDDETFNKILPVLVSTMNEIGFDNIIKNYNDNLKSSKNDWESLKKKEINNNYISSTSTVGCSIVKRHMPHIYDVKNYKGKCISNQWTEKNIKDVLEINRRTHSSPYISEIVRQIGFKSGTSKVTIYRPLLTKRIVEYYKAQNVLDVCVGWGGRMLGSSCIPDVKYTGIEPFSKTYEGLVNIKKDLELNNVILHNDTAENILPTLKKEYDLSLTSPPYYNLEIYSEESNQSHQYGSYEEWNNNFLKPVVYGVLSKLIKGGKSCWSIKNFKTDKKYNLYDDIVKLHKECGWKKVDTEFYVGNCLRPGLKDSDGKSMKSKEITYVFMED